MRDKKNALAVAGLCLLLLVAVLSRHLWLQQQQLSAIEDDTVVAGGELELHEPLQHMPDFSAITDVKAKKQAFFDYFYPLVVEENRRILAEREQLLSHDRQSAVVRRLCEKYSNDCDEVSREQKHLLVRRIDVVPPSLALAQAAKESGWGTSRFATEGNNFFGQWCFRKGCGLVPSSRKDNASHEVRRFDSPQLSVRAYLLNLNTGDVYTDLRKLRLQARQAQRDFDGLELAATLLYYSERREAYVEELTDLIRYNELQAYDQRFWQQLQLDANLADKQ